MHPAHLSKLNEEVAAKIGDAMVLINSGLWADYASIIVDPMGIYLVLISLDARLKTLVNLGAQSFIKSPIRFYLASCPPDNSREAVMDLFKLLDLSKIRLISTVGCPAVNDDKLEVRFSELEATNPLFKGLFDED